MATNCAQPQRKCLRPRDGICFGGNRRRLGLNFSQIARPASRWSDADRHRASKAIETAAALRNSETIRAASSECPPRSRKKSSRTETGSGANNFVHTAAIVLFQFRPRQHGFRPRLRRARGAAAAGWGGPPCHWKASEVPELFQTTPASCKPAAARGDGCGWPAHPAALSARGTR